MSNKGLLIVISGPSGAGKGTICKRLSEEIKISVSATTRQPRIGEKEGVSYFYKTHKEFERMIEHGELLEWNKFCGNYYGTPRSSVQRMLDKGDDVVLEIDVNGGLAVRKSYPDAIFIFIMPPDLDELERRLLARGSETEENIYKRLIIAKQELTYTDQYDYIVINDELEDTVKVIKNIIKSERE